MNPNANSQATGNTGGYLDRLPNELLHMIAREMRLVDRIRWARTSQSYMAVILPFAYQREPFLLNMNSDMRPISNQRSIKSLLSLMYGVPAENVLAAIAQDFANGVTFLPQSLATGPRAYTVTSLKLYATTRGIHPAIPMANFFTEGLSVALGSLDKLTSLREVEISLILGPRDCRTRNRMADDVNMFDILSKTWRALAKNTRSVAFVVLTVETSENRATAGLGPNFFNQPGPNAYASTCAWAMGRVLKLEARTPLNFAGWVSVYSNNVNVNDRHHIQFKHENAQLEQVFLYGMLLRSADVALLITRQPQISVFDIDECACSGSRRQDTPMAWETILRDLGRLEMLRRVDISDVAHFYTRQRFPYTAFNPTPHQLPSTSQGDCGELVTNVVIANPGVVIFPFVRDAYNVFGQTDHCFAAQARNVVCTTAYRALQASAAQRQAASALAPAPAQGSGST